jgi:hypothetical protein
MVSLRVATERADLAKVDRQIIAAKREIRSLQTELGTRGRMTQLEDWNSNVLALSAPSAAQFVNDDVMLARLEKSQPTVGQRSADVRMASAEIAPAAPQAAPAPAPAAEAPKPVPHVVQAVAHPAPPQPALHHASYTPAAKSPLPPEEPKPAAKSKAERHAGAEPKKAPKGDAKPERHAKADPHAGVAKPAHDKKLAASKPAHEQKSLAKPAHDRKLAAAKPAHEQKPATKPARDRKLAAATATKPARHPAQESDAD